MNALAHGRKISPSLEQVIHSANPKKNPLARRGRDQTPHQRVIAVSRSSRRSKYPTQDGSFLSQIQTSVSLKEIDQIVRECETSGASPKTFGRVLQAATARLVVLKGAV